MPIILQRPFDVADHDQIVTPADAYKLIKGMFIIIDANVHKAEAFYKVGDRRTNLGETKTLSLKIILPDKKIVNENWIFDSIFEIGCTDFNFLLSLVNFSSWFLRI